MATLKRRLLHMLSSASNVRLQSIRMGRWLYRCVLKRTAWGKALRRQILDRGYVTSADFEKLTLSSLSAPSRYVPPTERSSHAADDFPGFNLSAPLNFEIHERLTLYSHINVLIPSLRLRHMSGGPNTALLLAAYLADRGERIRIISCDAPAEGEEQALYPHIDRLLLGKVDRDLVTLIDGFDRSRPIAIGANDLFLATAWWTAQIARYAMQKTIHEQFIYLIQDFEPVFHPASTFQARAAETYGFPHIPVINTRLLLDHFVKERIGCYGESHFVKEALCFEPAIDRTRYYPASKQRQHGGVRRHVLLFYARPKVALRNLFEMGVVALRRAVEAGCIDEENWALYAMGETVETIELGNGVVINPLPWLTLDEYAERVRTADVLLSLMLSPHPSYPPLEMAASGNLVVTNSFSVKSKERLYGISPNIVVAEPTIDSITEHLKYAIGRINAGLRNADQSVIDLPSSWEESLCPVMSKLKERIDTVRNLPRSKNKYVASGRPQRPLSEYEAYRKTRLWERRLTGSYVQIPGLLSFVTSAYNTDPAFLEELASSLCLQDGGTSFEWFILDNGCTNEKTRQCLGQIAKHPYVRLHRVPENLGIIGGMRYCLEHATGRYILPLDSDDVVEPDCVHVLTRFIQEAGYPALLYTDEDKLIQDRFVEPYFKPDWDPVLFLHSCYIAHLCAMDREKAIALNLYSDPAAEGCHDWDSFIRFMNAGYVPQHLPEVLYSWRMHHESTAGNIGSKSYITDSHRAVLQQYLNGRGVSNIELINSPLFQFNVDWWFKRRPSAPMSHASVRIQRASDASCTITCNGEPLRLDAAKGLVHLAEIVNRTDSELVHICWDGVAPDNDVWLWEAMALIELFPDTVMVGGILHDGAKVLDGPRVFGVGHGCECPDHGRPLSEPGYGVHMWKQRSVSAVSTGHCVIVTDFLRDALPELVRESVCIEMLGPWLGALAREKSKRVVFSPFLRAAAVTVPEDCAEEGSRSHFLSRFWSLLPENRFYSPRLGLTQESAYVPVNDVDRVRHLQRLQLHTLPYSGWLNRELMHRSCQYPTSVPLIGLSIITPVYHGSDLRLLSSLAEAITAQSVQPAEWLLIVNGPMSDSSMEWLQMQASEWNARIIVEPHPIGIVKALRLGLEAAQGEYVLPVDADDLITPDALFILVHEIQRLARPDLVYTDEDLFVDGQPTMPCLRSAFDAVLTLDNSIIWHACAMKRSTALRADVYGDGAANWCQDWDSISRIRGLGGRLEHVPHVIYHWRQHSGSTTNKEAGDPRSLDSVRHILERHIALTAIPEHFFVADWPHNRGARELYIARRGEALPRFVSMGNMEEHEWESEEDAVLICVAPGVSIQSEQVFVEVARLFELHPQVGTVGGLVVSKEDIVVEGCSIVNQHGTLECPWLGHSIHDGGPYGLALKPQTVAIAGASLAFFRVSALIQARVWPVDSGSHRSDRVTELCGRLGENNWAAAFSPLVYGRAGSSFYIQPYCRRPPIGMSPISGPLARYGLSRNFQLTR